LGHDVLDGVILDDRPLFPAMVLDVTKPIGATVELVEVPLLEGVDEFGVRGEADEILESYRPKRPEWPTYTVDDHKHLAAQGATRALFEKFRVEILALDECVSEKFLKLYVAYKAETNFVDIVPQASGLRLSFNVPFHDLDDPKGLCTDVTNLGRWGNGSVEFRLTKEDDLPYAIGLTRQALDKQLGDEEDGTA